MTHKTPAELRDILTNAREHVDIGEVYHHYKDHKNQYRVIDVALFEEDIEPYVIYEPLHGEKLRWVRPLSDWLAIVETENGKVPRFKKI